MSAIRIYTAPNISRTNISPGVVHSSWHTDCSFQCCVVQFIIAFERTKRSRTMPLALIIMSLFIQFFSLCSYPLNRVAVISNYGNCTQNYYNLLLDWEQV
jgi:hypothetical protein